MDTDAKQKLWEEYSAKRSAALREQLILEYVGLVKIVAGKLSMYLGYNVEYDDLVGYGTFGLIDAIDKFDYDKGVKFETYASLRIRGAILDEVRKMDWIPRSLRQKQKQLDAVYQKIEAKTGRMATEEEVAEALGITSDELTNLQAQAQVGALLSLDECMETGEPHLDDTQASEDYVQPERIMERKELKEILTRTLKELTEKEQKVIFLYYFEELTLKEISAVLEVTESRISQLHTRALQKMRARLGGNMDLFFG
ncbi:MAG: FliA/WhiG family RNA polymerase sigma factor [Lachnospiraceae bacterium]|nr:FliA/WhiG family RNA polymerase sigma factor [Lachnospiraceae bacterium]